MPIIKGATDRYGKPECPKCQSLIGDEPVAPPKPAGAASAGVARRVALVGNVVVFALQPSLPLLASVPRNLD